MANQSDAILIVGFGGPEGPDEVVPFLENVLRGRNVPRDRLLEVAEHYQHFGGVSPINQQVRDLIGVLKPELTADGIDLPIYWGNRNWHPLLPDTMQQMVTDGIRHALALVLSAFSSYSSCRQYQEDLQRARESVGEQAPTVEKIRTFYNHPDFVAANAARIQEVLHPLPVERRPSVHLAFTAHSIPQSMAEGCDYVEQLTETCRLVAEACNLDELRWKLVYQSRSGRPSDPWLEPDICSHLRTLRSAGVEDVIVHPIGFLSDHMEVMFDLDEEAQGVAQETGLRMMRSPTVGTHPRFVTMLRKLIEERLSKAPVEAIGRCGPSPHVCPVDCCPAPSRRPAAS